MVVLTINYRAIRHFRIVADSWHYILDTNGHSLHAWATDPEDMDYS